MKILKIIRDCIPLLVWAGIVLSITMYEVEVLLPIFIKSRFWVSGIIFLPCYMAILLFTPLFVGGYFRRKSENYLRRYDELQRQNKGNEGISQTRAD
jgi:hypothetical protein